MHEVIAFTGHRSVPEERVAKELDRLFGEIWPTRGLVGGAKGADTLAAEACIRFEVPYFMVLPHVDYPSKYKLDKDPRWRRTRDKADGIFYVVGGVPWHFSHNFKRNEFLVDGCETLVSISGFNPFREIPPKGGTAHCVRYARKVDRPIKWVQFKGRTFSAAT